MELTRVLRYIVLIFALLLIGVFSSKALSLDSLQIKLNQYFSQHKTEDFYTGQYHYKNSKKLHVDSIYAISDTLYLEFDKVLAEIPLREENVAAFQDTVRSIMADSIYNELVIRSNGMQLNELIPNYYKSKDKYITNRLPQNTVRPERKNVVLKNKLYEPANGLLNSNLAIWGSHGWYYDPSTDRWQWQRPKLFTTVEDISPQSIVVPFLAPMLENAGANVFMPRERDWQINEVIVDKDGSTGKSKLKKPWGFKKKDSGFENSDQITGFENPFKAGTSLSITKGKKRNAEYIGDFPEDGEYGVYISYAKGEGIVTYRVYHTGGITDFKVDQRMGFGTWIYLDKFYFKKGKSKETGKVELVIPKDNTQKITADAVRFGGGVGIISRNSSTSKRAKYFEGARYYLQYSGAPDTLVWNLYQGKNDYVDDYKSRGEWVNWLVGNPFGPNKNRNEEGLKISVDLSIGIHTDAGIVKNDEIIGSLGIYCTNSDSAYFPDGQSKYASRDLTDLVQSQLVDDISKKYQVNWTRRGMWNADYSEVYRPNVPSMLFELLSHQNFNDVQYLLHPQFKFDMARAMYKGILRFIATQYDYEYVVQPLPVKNLSSEIVNGNSVKLKWTPVEDPLETSAKAEKYIIYKGIGDAGFDNGIITENTEISIPILAGKLYKFKVTAVNAGGESFPSEIISAGISTENKGTVMIINGFDRIDAPETFKIDSTYSGVSRATDLGVAYGYDLSTTGDQYDYETNSTWINNDAPGHGGSYADLETTVFMGNTFDFSVVHGESILNAGYSFATSSDEAIENELVDLSEYKMLDLLYGEEKSTTFPGGDSTIHFSIYTDKMLNALEQYTSKGGNVLISGAYIGTDIPTDSLSIKRVGNLFKFRSLTDHAVKNITVEPINNSFNTSAKVNTDYKLDQYAVESPDALIPFNSESTPIYRYNENGTGAGVAFDGNYKVVALGFPFECIIDKDQRDSLMNEILQYLNK